MIACSRCSLFLLVLYASCILFTGPAKAGQTPPISLTIPVSTLHQALSSLLPLPIEPRKRNSNFQGPFVVDSISRLAVKQNNVIALQGQLSGRNMAVNARVGGQTIQIKLGQMVLPVSCDIALHCNGDRAEMAAVVAAASPLSAEAAARDAGVGLW